MREAVIGSETRRALVGASLFLCLGAVVVALLWVASPAGSMVHAEGVKVGLISDEGGFGDLSFNWLSLQGLLRAEADLGVESTLYESDSPDDYETNLQQCANEGNALCISVGFLLSDTTWSAAQANPATHFAIVDMTYESYPDNLRGMTFSAEEAGYLAGTLAGLMTESDVVGAVGGMRIPPVQAFLEPYRYGAGCANADARAIISYTGTFTNPELGAQVAQGQMAQGADVVFGAGGLTGNGAILTAAQAAAWAIGVDVDQWVSLFGSGGVPGSERLLSSAMKRLDNAVYDTIVDEVGGAFTAGTVLYDLAVDGVGLAPYHQAEPAIPQAVQDAVEAVRQGILNGGVDPWESCAPGDHVGLVFDSAAGAADLSFNWLAYEGLLRAENDLGVVGTTYTPTTPDDYRPLLQQCVDDGNALCLSVGFLMGDPTGEAAAANPGVDFAIVDMTYESYPDNLRGMAFAVEQAGYLAGTLAGLMTESDVVGGVGGMEIPPVVAFLEPYRNGAQCANPWAGVVITYTGTFTDPDLGAQVAQAQMDQGGDVIFGAAGPTGNGAILAAAQSGAWAIGVDVDQWVSLFGSGSVPGSERLLSSVMKRIDNAVYDTIADEVGAAFTPGTAVYDLAVDGVGLAPFHEAEPSIPQTVKDVVEAVRQDILDGDIDVWQPCGLYRIYLPMVLRGSPAR